MCVCVCVCVCARARACAHTDQDQETRKSSGQNRFRLLKFARGLCTKLKNPYAHLPMRLNACTRVWPLEAFFCIEQMLKGSIRP